MMVSAGASTARPTLVQHQGAAPLRPISQEGGTHSPNERGCITRLYLRASNQVVLHGDPITGVQSLKVEKVRGQILYTPTPPPLKNTLLGVGGV